MKRILIVDDNEDIRLLLHLWLERELSDCEFIEAATARQAMQLLASHEFNLIISDYVTPSGSGLDLYHFARSIGLWTPFIFYSGSPPSLEIKEEFSAGNCAYIENPEYRRVAQIASEMIH